VDLQLYAFIAIIIREFVLTWYGKITNDQVFVQEVVRIIAHCSRALEQRLRKVDLEVLLFDELPELLEVHVKGRLLYEASLHPPPFEGDPRGIYHALWPSPALSPVPDGKETLRLQMENEAAYRQLLVQGVLALLLPTEDLENECLTTLVGQIFSEMILGSGIGGKACEPWLLWEGIIKIGEAIPAQLPKSKARVRVERSNSDIMSSANLNLIGGSTNTWSITLTFQRMFWLILQYIFLAFTVVRFLVVTFATSSSLPSRTSHMMKSTSSPSSQDYTEAPQLTNTPSQGSSGRQRPPKQPIMTMKIWSCAASLLDFDIRMPWLSATISLLQWGALTGPGKLGNTDGMIDKILSHAIKSHVLDASRLPSILRLARAAVFPHNTLASPRVVPDMVEQLAIRRRCAETLLEVMPLAVQDVFFGLDSGSMGERVENMESRVKEVEEVLDVFGDSYCNRHLMFGVVDLVLVRLMPELAEKGVEELLQERLS